MFDPLISIGANTFFIELLAVIFLGLVLGSFSSALIYRVPRSIPWGVVSLGQKKTEQPDIYRSACPECLHPLGMLDLVPVCSWLLLRGKCRHCGVKIGATYILAELLSLVAVLGLYAVFDLTPYSLLYVFLIPFLVALLFIDFAYMLLPNVLVGICAVLGMLKMGLLIFAEPEMMGFYLTHYIGGALLYGFVAWGVGAIIGRVLCKDSLGFGDVKFFAMVGLWLGFDMISHFMIISGVLGVLLAIIWRRIMKQEVFPFGPALIVSFYILILVNGSHF